MSRESTAKESAVKEFAPYECETCVIHDQAVQIPRFLVENERLFLSLMSMETWNRLSNVAQKELLKLLPGESEIGKQEIVQQLLTKKNFHFGNPIKKFHRRLHDGSFHPDISTFSNLCRRAKYKDYLFRQKDHFSQLVVDILPSRQIVLDVASLLPEGIPLKIKPLSAKSRDLDSPSKRQVYSRASLEYYRALAEVRQDVADDGETSSEDEAFPDEAPLRLKAKGFSSSDPTALDIRTSDGGSRHSVKNVSGEEDDRREVPTRQIHVMNTLAPEVDPVSTDEFEDASLRSVAPTVSPLTAPCINERRYKNMLKNHRNKRRKKQDTASKYYRPDLDTEGIDLTDVIRRTEISIANIDDELVL